MPTGGLGEGHHRLTTIFVRFIVHLQQRLLPPTSRQLLGVQNPNFLVHQPAVLLPHQQRLVLCTTHLLDATTTTTTTTTTNSKSYAFFITVVTGIHTFAINVGYFSSRSKPTEHLRPDIRPGPRDEEEVNLRTPLAIIYVVFFLSFFCMAFNIYDKSRTIGSSITQPVESSNTPTYSPKSIRITLGATCITAANNRPTFQHCIFSTRIFLSVHSQLSARQCIKSIFSPVFWAHRRRRSSGECTGDRCLNMTPSCY
jgi:hypothetical protein